MSSSTNCWVERHATTAFFFFANSSPMALSRCVFPSPLRPTMTSGLYFLPGLEITSRAALRATSFERSEEHTSELQSQSNLVCRLLLEKKKKRIRLIKLPENIVTHANSGGSMRTLY